MRIFFLILLFTILRNVATAQSVESLYLDSCEAEFNTLLRKISESEKVKWISKRQSIDSFYNALSSELQGEKSIYEKINALDVYYFYYSNKINDYLLPHKTSLINSFGEEIVSNVIGDSVKAKIDFVGRELNKYSNTRNASNFFAQYKIFLASKEQFLKLQFEDKELFYVIYEPKTSAYSQPYTRDRYAVFDWEGKIENLKKINQELENVIREIKTNQYLVILDPNPAISVLFQICTLLVLISNLLLNFKYVQKLHNFILGFVLLSLITSFVLLFVSENTILNSLINIIVPAIAYLIFYSLKRKKNS